MYESVITTSWSEIPGTTVVSLMRDVLVVKHKSRIFPDVGKVGKVLTWVRPWSMARSMSF